MRITGLASGLDMDEIVKNSMKPYRVKIDKQVQNKEILEIKQKLYREIIKDSREFYNKYFDITKSDSLLLNKNWAITKFTSSNENILAVTASGDAKPENYTVTGTKAKAAKYALTTGIESGNKVVINGEEFTLKGNTEKEIANYLNGELKGKGINVNVRYTDFAGTTGGINASGLVFEASVLGEDSRFTLGGEFTENIGRITQGTNSTAATTNSDRFTVQALKDSDGKIRINNNEVQIDINDVLTNSDIEKLLQNKLKNSNLTAEVNESGEITFKTIELGKKEEYPIISIGTVEETFTTGENATSTKNSISLTDIGNNKITINGNLIDLTGKNLGTDVINHINKVLKEQGVAITAAIEPDGILLTSNNAGSQYDIDVRVAKEGITLVDNGDDAEITILNTTSGGVYTHKGIANTVTLDGVTFKFAGDMPTEGVIINGKNDVTEVKDKLVKFINDYNTLIEKLNTLTTDKRNRSFAPLTADQKKEMSEDEIKLWNEKVQKGQLSRDSDLSRISNSLKQSMRTLVDGTGLNLEKIGISPVADYQGTKNGTYTIDESKLIKALEENSQQIIDMFIKVKPDDKNLSDSAKYSKTGILQRVKDILYSETVTVTSSLLKKAGIEGSSTSYTNEITKSIQKYEQKMADMEKDFTRREQALYTKYANLETIMNKYNSQQSYLAQQLGLS